MVLDATWFYVCYVVVCHMVLHATCTWFYVCYMVSCVFGEFEHDEPALEEADVDDGGVEVDELEDEHLEDELVLELRLRAVHLCTQGGAKRGYKSSKLQRHQKGLFTPKRTALCLLRWPTNARDAFVQRDSQVVFLCLCVGPFVP